MVETNVKTRTDLLNFLAENYNLQRYLEIGVQNPTQNFYKINCGHKVSVDPDPKAKALYEMTSDEYFKLAHKFRWIADLVFIDGLHTAEQVKKDFENALKILSPNAFIVLHDCNPLKEEHTIVPRPTERGHWNGDVYKFAAQLQTYAGIKGCTVNIDNGCAVIQVTGPVKKEWDHDITWAEFDRRRDFLLNLISWDEFIASHSHL